MKMLKPLRWPEGWNRTEARKATVGVLAASEMVKGELDALGAMNVVFTANADADENEGRPDDPGAAAYFNLDGRPYVVACDRWDQPSANLYEICQLLRILGASFKYGEAIQDRALQGFTELPPEKAGIGWPLHWMRVMGTLPDWNRMMPETQRRWIDQRYAELMKQPMSEQAFRDLRQARVEAFADVGAYVMGDKE